MRSNPWPVVLAVAALFATPASATAQELTRGDSALIGRILLAEDRRDPTDGALREGAAHPDVRVSTLARRAAGRIVDPAFAARDSLPPLAPPPTWVEPRWRLRYRNLLTLRDDCGAMRIAIADSALAIRLRTADLLRASCADDAMIIDQLHRWLDDLLPKAASRSRGQTSWHTAAHGIVALVRLRPGEARQRIAALSGHHQPELRQHVARAAALLADTATLRALATDADDNVAAVAIDSLSALTGHADDAIYLRAITRRGAQVVRAGAMALTGSPRPDVAEAALQAFERFVRRANASERDARVALLAAAGRPASEDRAPPSVSVLPPNAIALALGADVRLRVTMTKPHGGGSFVVRLRGDVAPMMAARVTALAGRGYYDGLSWHRVEANFVIQGGSPGSNEYVGHADYLRDELAAVPHKRGTVGMSTRGHDTGDAQWFVNLVDNLRLTRDHTVWAEVVDGIDVVDGILEGDIIRNIRVVKK